MERSKVKAFRWWFATLATLAFLVGSIAPAGAQQRRSGTRAKKPVYFTVQAGHTMRVRLNEEINSETARVGDTFTATLVDPVYSSGGVELAPQGSALTGRVTNVQRAGRKGQPASIDVQFISLRLPNGRRSQLNGSLTDLSTSSASSDNEGTVSANKTKHRKVKFIGGGAAGGALIGALAGGGKGAAIGAGVGAGAGILGGRLKKGHEIKIKSGTEFGVILNRSFALPKYGAA